MPVVLVIMYTTLRLDNGKPGITIVVVEYRVRLFDFTKTLTDFDMLLAADRLIAKEEHTEFQQGSLDLQHGGVIERLCQIDTADERAEMRRTPFHFNNFASDDTSWFDGCDKTPGSIQ